MSWSEFEPDDPMVLVGVAAPADAGAIEEMAWIFAEEFARLGFNEPALLSLFRRPFYAGAHRAWRRLGEERIREIVAECVAAFAPSGAGDGDRAGEGSLRAGEVRP